MSIEFFFFFVKPLIIKLFTSLLLSSCMVNTEFFICHLATPRPISRPISGNHRVDILTKPVLITAFWFLFQPKGHCLPRNEVVSPSPAKCLVKFEPGTFLFDWNVFTHRAIAVIPKINFSMKLKLQSLIDIFPGTNCIFISRWEISLKTALRFF